MSLIEDIQVPPEPAKKRMATKKPQPEPVKEINRLTEVPHPKIQNPEMTNQSEEARVEPVKEVMKEPAKGNQGGIPA